MPIPRRAWLAAFFEFFEGGLELRNQKFAVIRDVGDGGLPILDGVRLVAESGVAASQSQIGPKLFFRMALLVELKEALVVGMIRISSLDHDFFVFDPARQRITGRRSKMSFAVGDRVIVQVARVDSFRQRIDFAFLAKE